MTPGCLKSCTLGCASSCNVFVLFLFPSCNMLVQDTNAGLFPFYQYTCKLLSSKVTSEVLFNCLFIFAASCMMIPSACHCSLHFHAVCQCCSVSKLRCKCVCGILPRVSRQQIFCGHFTNPWIPVTISGMGGAVIKGVGAVAQDWSIPEV